MKQAALRMMRASGVFAACRRLQRGKILILTYHRFSAEPARAALAARAFAEQIQYLRAHHTIVPLSAIERHFVDGAPLPPAPVAITIDDGYHDVYDVAFPVLRRHQAPATLFAATDFIDRQTWLWTDKMRAIVRLTSSDRVAVEVGTVRVDAPLGSVDSRLAAAGRLNEALKRLPDEAKEDAIARIEKHLGVKLPASPPADCRPVTCKQLRELAGGGVDIGSHTVTHPILPWLARERVAWELRESRRRLEEILDREVTTFCYPNGDYDAAVRDEAACAGYRLAVTTEPGLNTRANDPLALRRVHTDPDLTHFIQNTSGFERIKQRFRELKTRSARSDNRSALQTTRTA